MFQRSLFLVMEFHVCIDTFYRNCSSQSLTSFYKESAWEANGGQSFSLFVKKTNKVSCLVRQHTRFLKQLVTIIPTSAALLAVLGPSLSNTLGLREGGVVLMLLSDMVFVFSTVTFRLILDILQGCVRKTARHQH